VLWGSHFLASFRGLVLLNSLGDWSFEVVILSWGVFDLEAHLLGEVGARVVLKGFEFDLIVDYFFFS